MAAYQAAGCRVLMGEQVTDLENGLNLSAYDTAVAIERMESSVATLDGRLGGRMRAWTMPFTLDVCGPELLIAKRIADEHETAMTFHHSGGAGQPGPTPTQRLAEIGVLGPNVVLSHAMNLVDGDVALVATGERIRAATGISFPSPWPVV